MRKDALLRVPRSPRTKSFLIKKVSVLHLPLPSNSSKCSIDNETKTRENRRYLCIRACSCPKILKFPKNARNCNNLKDNKIHIIREREREGKKERQNENYCRNSIRFTKDNVEKKKKKSDRLKLTLLRNRFLPNVVLRYHDTIPLPSKNAIFLSRPRSTRSFRRPFPPPTEGGSGEGSR